MPVDKMGDDIKCERRVGTGDTQATDEFPRELESTNAVGDESIQLPPTDQVTVANEIPAQSTLSLTSTEDTMSDGFLIVNTTGNLLIPSQDGSTNVVPTPSEQPNQKPKMKDASTETRVSTRNKKTQVSLVTYIPPSRISRGTQTGSRKMGPIERGPDTPPVTFYNQQSLEIVDWSDQRAEVTPAGPSHLSSIEITVQSRRANLREHTSRQAEEVPLDSSSSSNVEQLSRSRENSHDQINPITEGPPPIRRCSSNLETPGQRPQSVTSAKKSNASTTPRLCWNCRQPDHCYSACPSARNVFCHMCGRRGYTAKTCPNCGKEWKAMGPYVSRYGRNLPRSDRDHPADE